jgi:RNA polymerase sigma-70 factor (ECF subfamily)
MPLNHEEISALYREHSPLLLRYLMRRTFDAQVAVDLLAETFAVAYEKRAKCDDAGAARAWVFGIANNLLLDYFRSGSTERRAIDRLGIDVPPIDDEDLVRIEDLAGTAELRGAIAEGLRTLSLEHQVALDLRVVQERSYPDVAKAMGVTEQVARARVSRALKKLKGVVDDSAPEEVLEHA